LTASTENDFTACTTHNSITRYTIGTDGVVSEVKDCIQDCNLAGTNASRCMEGGYYIVNESTKAYIDDPAVTTGKLYQCSSSTSCALVTDIPIGYLVNAGNKAYTAATDVPYIQCKEVTGGEKQCSPIAVSTKTDCTQGTAAGLIAVDSNGAITYTLCLATSATDGIPLNSDDTEGKSYLIGMESANTFGALKASHFVIVNLSHGNVILNKDTLNRYQFTAQNSKEVYEQVSSNVNNFCNDGTPKTLDEYVLDKADTDTVDYYKKASS